jgi:hypothetical protein
MDYYDKELKEALAKMLPEKTVQILPYGRDDNKILCWDFNKQPILNNELLDLCNQVELTLSWSEYSIFRKGLMNQLMRIESASWQQRVKSLAITKGIKI